MKTIEELAEQKITEYDNIIREHDDIKRLLIDLDGRVISARLKKNFVNKYIFLYDGDNAYLMGDNDVRHMIGYKGDRLSVTAFDKIDSVYKNAVNSLHKLKEIDLDKLQDNSDGLYHALSAIYTISESKNLDYRAPLTYSIMNNIADQFNKQTLKSALRHLLIYLD